ncbi:MAG: hypothetical protein Ct9H300mP32_5290 [Verrucomicrobiota bacterium]|nr:MAG: hypothetical protein Ct9H300mP32_5290 [Verrucomicrobiota bacterium]
MDFPAEPAVECAPPDDLAKPLGSEILWCGQNRMDILVQIPMNKRFATWLQPFSCLARLGTRGVIVTAISENGPADFVSRFFCPSLGIDEDPVTGSAIVVSHHSGPSGLVATSSLAFRPPDAAALSGAHSPETGSSSAAKR